MRILSVSGYGYWGDITPDDLKAGSKKQVGGGETAMFSINRELAKLGHEVIAFYGSLRGRYDGVDYLPNNLFVGLSCNIEHDVLVSWDFPAGLRFAGRQRSTVLAFQLNDTYVGPYRYVVDLYFHPSEWHAKRYQSLYPEIDWRKVRHGVTNAIDPKRYEFNGSERNTKRVIHSSSPDRGLHHLLRMWPEIQRREPTSELHVFYNMDGWFGIVDKMRTGGLEANTAQRADLVRSLMKSTEDASLNVHFHGSVSQWELAKEQMKSGLLVYPCDPVQPTEGFSMTCLEGIAAGCQVITSNADALGELWTDAPGTVVLPLPIEDGVWIETIVNGMNSNGVVPSIKSDYTWPGLAKIWERELELCLASK